MTASRREYKRKWALQNYYKDHEANKEAAKLRQRRRNGFGNTPLQPRALAKLEGKTRYFTGKPCANGHVAERIVSNGRCIECMYEWRERRWAERPQERKAASTKRGARVRADPRQRLMAALRQRLNRALKGNYKSGSAVRDLGCSIEFFKEYIEAQFLPKMSWDNHGTWHLDHIRPLHQFDLSVREQFLDACHYTNYQPLWALDNLRKNKHALVGRE